MDRQKISAMTVISLLLLSGLLGALGAGQIGSGLDYGSAGDYDSVMANGVSKTKTIYLHNEAGTVNTIADVLTMNTTMGQNQNITEWDKAASLFYDWYLDPPFAGEFVLNGTVKLSVWMVQKDATGATNFATIHMTLYDVDDVGAETDIGTYSTYYGDIRTAFSEYSVSGNYSRTFPPGHSLRVGLRIDSNEQVGTRIGFGDAEFPSRLELETDTYMQLDSMSILDYTYQENYTYLSSATNKTIYFNATVTDPFGGYDIWDVQLTILDPNGTAILDGISMTRAIGSNTSFICNYTYSWDFSNATDGQYTAIISAIDQTGYNYRYPDHPDDETYGGHLESLQKNFWIGVERFDVHFKTVDSLGLIMFNATVEIRSLTDSYIIHNYTNESGITKIGLSTGNYNVLVHWQGIEVNSTTYEVTGTVPASGAVLLNCSVYYPTYRVVDVAYENVSSANLFIRHPNGTLITTFTGADGTVDLDQMAGGEYTIRTEWLGKEVNTTVQELASNDEFRINAAIYYLTVTTLDSMGEAVPDVHVLVEFNDTKRIADAKLTDAQGNMTARLPGTASGFGYDIICQWRGVYVGGAANISLDANGTVVITLEIYYVEFHTVDSLGLDLEYTRLLAFTNETGSLANTAETDITGNATMRLPGGNHTVEAYWRGIHVGTHYFTVDDSGLVETVICRVYHVIFTLTDSRDIPLENAQIVISHTSAGVLNSNVTDGTGKAKARLPGATVDIDVKWRDVSVYTGSLLINFNGDLPPIQCGVYYLSVKAEDDNGEPLGNAKVEYLHGDNLLATATTAENGTTSESRLPGTTLAIRAHWKNILVYDGAHLLDANAQITITAMVYHVDIEVVDSIGEIIPDATVNVLHDGVLLHTGQTDGEGITLARLPVGLHDFQVYWKGILIYDSVAQINESGKITLQAIDVFHVTFLLLDSRSEPVTGASIALEISGTQIAYGTIDGSGMHSVRVPTPVGTAGNVRAVVHWSDLLVYDGHVQISSNHFPASPIVLDVAVYYIDYLLLDQKDVPIANSRVSATHQGLPEGKNVIGERLTDGNGQALFRIPGGTITLSAFWMGVAVNTTAVELENDVNITAHGAVYYLEVNVHDQDGVPLGDSLVTISYNGTGALYQANHTGTEGVSGFRIPASSWEINVVWMNTAVYDGVFHITGAEESWTLELQAKVYYLTVRTEDKGGESLSQVHVVIESGIGTWSGYTESGESVFRLPGRDDYSVKAEFKSTYLLTDVNLDQSKVITLQESGTETIRFEAYPPSMFSTNLFFVLLAFIVLLAILALLYLKLRPAAAPGEDASEMHEEEPTDEKPVEESTETDVSDETSPSDETDTPPVTEELADGDVKEPVPDPDDLVEP